MKFKHIKHFFIHSWTNWELMRSDGEMAWFTRKCLVCPKKDSKYMNVKTGKRIL